MVGGVRCEEPLLVMPKTMGKFTKKSRTTMSGIDDLGADLLHNILARLPASAFASAACVSRSWNSLCNRLLSSPKLVSAVSFNPFLQDAVCEVVDKVLSEPIRPHFALASIGPSFNLQAALELIDGKLGSTVPIIVNVSEGIIGQDVRTSQFVEVQWELTLEEAGGSPQGNVNPGIILTIGFFPGLKTYALPFLFQHKGGLRDSHIDEFVMDIRKYTSLVSDSESPAGVILFAEQQTEINPILQKIEYAFDKDTFIVGDGCTQFLYKNDMKNTVTRSEDSTCAIVALLFARDRNKPSGIGETEFHVMLSTGVSPVGETYKAVRVKNRKNQTWLTASRGTDRVQLDGQAIVDQIYEELGDRIQYPVFYIGVTKRRRCTVGMNRPRRMQFHEFHYVSEGNEEYLFVDAVGIQTGDPFRVYATDSSIALSSSNKVHQDLSRLKADCNCKMDRGLCHCDKPRVFGGMIFSCCGRGNSFFEHPGIDSAPFLNNFPGVTFGGTYCAGEIARSCLSSYDQDYGQSRFVHCNQHVYSAVYLVMLYTPPVP